MAGYIVRRNRYATRVVTPDPAPAAATVIEARKCRGCGSTNIDTAGGSHKNKHGKRVQYCVCKDCGKRNIYIITP